MEQLKAMKQTLTACVQGQMGRLNDVDAKELGEAVDMIKDLSEAIYYCTITEAMEGKEHEKERVYYVEPRYMTRDIDRPMGRMYYDDRNQGDTNNRNYMEYTNGNGGNGSSSSNGMSNNRNFREREIAIPMRDYREGRSPMSRRMYMETKEMHADKATSMKELEKYVQELTHDIVEMVADASPEEKQYLEKRISSLASKIGQTTNA